MRALDFQIGIRILAIALGDSKLRKTMHQTIIVNSISF